MKKKKTGKFPRTVVCVIWIGNKILLCQRLKEDRFKGGWQATGGKVEDWETFEQAAIREAEEECGIEIPQYMLSVAECIEDDPSTDKCFLFESFLPPRYARLVKRTEPNKHGPWKLFTVAQAKKLKLLPGLTKYFKRFK
jgi:8-oxo-dGTP pyrophosphatase MutT (NUDIX family)